MQKKVTAPIVTKADALDLPTAKDRSAALDRIVANAARRHGTGRVEYAQNTNASYLLRRPTGITSLDIAMAGGWPASAPNVLVGPDGAGKDYLLWRTMAEAQRNYGDDFCAAVYFTEFKMDKMYMKDMCGLQIAMSDEELEELDRARVEAGMKAFTAFQIDHYKRQIGNFVAIYGLSADHGFDELFELLCANFCQIIAVNSIGFMQTEAKEATESYEEFAQQRSEAALLSKVLPQFAKYLNSPDKYERHNETTVLLVNQVRSKDAQQRTMKGRTPLERDGYKTAANAWALKHGKAIEVFLHNGTKIMDEEAKPPYQVGRKKQWEISKGKLGTHEGLRGEFDYIFHYGADMIGDLVDTASKLGVIQVNGAWFSYDDEGFRFKTQGAPRTLEVLRKDPALVEHLRVRCFQEARIPFRVK